MSGPVQEWLKAQGYTAYCEVPFYGRAVDIVAEKDATSHQITVEMKVCLSCKVMIQAVELQTATPLVYCAVASKPRESSIEQCRKQGLGILTVGQDVTVILEPEQKIEPYKHRRFNLSRLEPGGIAGLPNIKGVGPAQEVEKRIAEYRKTHPKATWKELYEAISNHYQSYRGMYGGMRMLKERRYRAEWVRKSKLGKEKRDE